MKIAFISSTYFPNFGGAEIMLHNLLHALMDKYQIEITLYVPYTSYRYIRANSMDKKIGYAIKPLIPGLFRLRFFSMFLNRVYLWREQAKYNYVLWHANVLFPVASLLSWIHGPVKKVLTAHGADMQVNEKVNYGMRLQKKIDAFVRASCVDADALVAISHAIESLYCDISEACGKKTKLIPNGIDPQRFVAREEKRLLREKLNVPVGKKMILSIGRNYPVKGFELIPKLMHELLRLNLSFVWVHVGEGASTIVDAKEDPALMPFFIPCEKITVGDAHGSCVERLSFLPDQQVIDYYGAADVFVNTSLLEAMPVTVLEAMAASLPVVAAAVSGCIDVIRNNENGLLVERENIPAFADAIFRIVNDISLNDSFTTQGRADVERMYDRKDVVDAYYGLYCELLSVS